MRPAPRLLEVREHARGAAPEDGERVLRPPLEGGERETLEDARTSEDGEGEEASETKDEL